MLSMVLCACGGPRTHIPEKDLVSIARDVIADDIVLINKEKIHKDLIAYTFRDRYDRDFTFTSVIYPATGIDGVHIYGYVTKVETTYFKQLWISYADEIKSIIAEFEEGKENLIEWVKLTFM